MNEFWDTDIEIGYYDKVLKSGLIKNKGIQANWHRSTFLRVSSFINERDFHLDYACGPGTFAGNFLYGNSLNTDISDKQIEYANKNYGEKGEYIKFDKFHFNNYKESFNIITVLGLLEFIDDETIVELINNFHNSLKPGGKVVLTTPNYGGLMYFLELVLNKIGKLDYTNQHVNRFDKKRVNKIIEKTNFESIKIEKFINFGIFSSFISFKFSDKLMLYIDKFFNNFFGFLLLIELKK